MNKILIVLGDLATGKSTYSNILGKHYNCLVLNKDVIKEGLADAIGFKNREENKKLSNGTFNVMKYCFDKIALTHQDIILEANFHDEELDILYEDIETNNYQVLTLVLSADIDILFKRFMNRALNENRHPVHVTSDLTDIDSFKKYILSSRNQNIQGETIKMNADDFSYQDEKNFIYFDRFFNGK